jgi:hypothetical protein
LFQFSYHPKNTNFPKTLPKNQDFSQKRIFHFPKNNSGIPIFDLFLGEIWESQQNQWFPAFTIWENSQKRFPKVNF